MMKRLIIFVPLLLAFVISLTAVYPVGAGVAPSVDPRKAAMDAFISIKDPKNSGYLQELEDAGYISRADLEKAELGEGFQIFSFIRKVESLTDNVPYDPAIHLTPTNTWGFLIRVEGKAKTILSINFTKYGEIQFGIGIPFQKKWDALAGSIEDDRHAKELDGLLTTWPESSGYQYKIIDNIASISPIMKLIRVVELSQDGKVLGFIPLLFADDKISEGTATAGNFTAADLLDPNLFLAKLRSVAGRNKGLGKKQPNMK